MVFNLMTWLVIKNYTIDITGYYFDDQNEELVFSKESSWHNTFYHPNFVSYSEIMKFNKHFKKDFDLFYCVFKEKLERLLTISIYKDMLLYRRIDL